MKRFLPWTVVLLVCMWLYTSGASHGNPRPEYSPSTTQNAWLNGSTVYHPDEFAYVGIAYRMLLTREWNPRYYHNPPVNIYTNLGLFWLSGTENLPHNSDYGDREIAPFQLYVMARMLSALYALITVVLAYVIGQITFQRPVGWITAAIVALSPLIVQHAHYATPNLQTMMFSTAALLLALIIFKGRHPSRRAMWNTYFWGGFLVGLTMATRYNAVVVGFVTGLALLTAGWHHRRWLPVALGFIAMPLGLALGLPGAIFATSEVIDQVRDILNMYQSLGGGDGFTTHQGLSGFYYHWRYMILMGVGPVTTLAALLGLMLTLRRWYTAQQQDAWIGVVLTGYMLIYTVLALPGKRIQANLLFPLIVPLALLAGYGVVWLWEHWAAHRRWFATGLMVALLAWPSVVVGLFVYRITTPDNRMQAQAWVYKHVPRASSIYLLGPYNVPLDPLDYQISQTYAGETQPESVRHKEAQIIIYSDASPSLILRDRALSREQSRTREKAIQAILATEWYELVRFKRWFWPGENLPPDDVSYWHQIEIVVYCHATNCPVERSD